jgi:TonB family protein
MIVSGGRVIHLRLCAFALLGCVSAAEFARGAETPDPSAVGDAAIGSSTATCYQLEKLDLPLNLTAGAHTAAIYDYPRVSAKRGNIGIVQLRLVIGEDGKVMRAELARSSGFPRLDHAAIGMVEEDFHYTPAFVGGHTVASQRVMQVFWVQPAEALSMQYRLARGPVPTYGVPVESSSLSEPARDPAVDLPDGYASPDPPDEAPNKCAATIGPRDGVQGADQFAQAPKFLGPAVATEDFPLTSLNRGDRGLVLMNVLVNAMGRAEDAVVLSSSGHARLDHATIGLALEDWQYEPARDADGHAVPAWVTARVNWAP